MTDTIRTSDAPFTDEDAARLRTMALPSVTGTAGAPPGYAAGSASEDDADGSPSDMSLLTPTALPTRVFTRARTGLVVLVAFVVELVIIAAGANQAMTKHLARYAADHPVSFPGHAAHAALVYGWRFTPHTGGLHVWWGQLAGLGTVFLLGALLTAVQVRGVVTFWRALFGTWLAVLVATVAGVIVGSIVAATAAPLTSARVTDLVFSAPASDAAIAGAGLGLVTAIVAAIVATASRRRIEVEIPAELRGDDADAARPEDPPPFFGSAPADRDARQRFGVGDTSPDAYPVFTPGARASESPSEPAASETPAAKDSAAQNSAAKSSAARDSAADSTRTSEFPKPPDDEDLGHQPD